MRSPSMSRNRDLPIRLPFQIGHPRVQPDANPKARPCKTTDDLAFADLSSPPVETSLPCPERHSALKHPSRSQRNRSANSRKLLQAIRSAITPKALPA